MLRQHGKTTRPRVLSRSDAVRLGHLPPHSPIKVIDRSVLAPRLGRSVVAKRAIARGELVCTYGGATLSESECNQLETQHSNPFCERICYMLAIDDEWILDGYPKVRRNRTNLGSFINDHKNISRAAANVEFVAQWIDGERLLMLVRATAPINKGDELWASYGAKWWDFDTLQTQTPCKCRTK